LHDVSNFKPKFVDLQYIVNLSKHKIFSGKHAPYKKINYNEKDISEKTTALFKGEY